MTETQNTSLPNLYSGAGAKHYHRLSSRDNTEIASVLELLELLPDQAPDELRVLELACGSGRVTLPMAAAGHQVLATDLSADMLNLLAERLTEPRAIRSGIADRVEIRQADMTSFNFDESFKAVCLPTASITLLDPEQRKRALLQIASHLAPGGAVIVSTNHVLPEAATTTTIWLGPNARLTEEVDHTKQRRRTILNCGDGEEYVSDLHLVTPETLAHDLRDVGLSVTIQRSSPDPAIPHHVNIILGAVKQR